MNRYLPRIVPAVAALLAALMLVAAALALLDSPDAIFGGAPPVPTSRASSTPAGAVELQPGDTADQIAQRLHAAGVIDSPRRWTTIVQLLGWEEHLELGSYTFEAGLTSYEIARRIHTGERTPLRVTFPEGLRLEQIGELLEAEGVVAAADFSAALTHPAEQRRHARRFPPARRRARGLSLRRHLRLPARRQRRPGRPPDARALRRRRHLSAA